MMAVPPSGSVQTVSEAASTKPSFTFSDVKTEGSNLTRTFYNCVMAGETKYGLKVSASSSKPNILKQRFTHSNATKNVFNWYSDVSTGVTDETMWYVVDKNGTPIDWTGYITAWDIDTGEKFHIASACILDSTYIGPDIKTEASDKFADCTKYTASKQTESTTYTADNAVKKGVVLKIHIPTSGVKVGIGASSGGAIVFTMVKEIVTASNLSSSQGAWKPV